jgi:hypothetical protein
MGKLLTATKKATKKNLNTGKDIGSISINEIQKIINSRDYSFLQNTINMNRLEEFVFNFQTAKNLIDLKKSEYHEYKNKNKDYLLENKKVKIDEMMSYIHSNLFKLGYFDSKSINSFLDNKKKLVFSNTGKLIQDKLNPLYTMYETIENNLATLAKENKEDSLAATIALLTNKKNIDKTEDFFSKTIYGDTSILCCEFLRNLSFQIMNKRIDRTKCTVILHDDEDGGIGFENFERLQGHFEPMKGKIFFEGKQAVSAPTGSGKSKTFQSLAASKDIYDLFATNPMIQRIFLPKGIDSKKILFFRFNNTGEMKQTHEDHIKLSGFETAAKQLGLILNEVSELIKDGTAEQIHLISDEMFANAGAEAVQNCLDKEITLKTLLSKNKVSMTFIEHNKDTKAILSDKHIIFTGPIISVERGQKLLEIDGKYLHPNCIQINHATEPKKKVFMDNFLDKLDQGRHNNSTLQSFYFKINHSKKVLRKVSEAEFNKHHSKQPQNYRKIDYLPTRAEVDGDFSRPECNIIRTFEDTNN